MLLVSAIVPVRNEAAHIRTTLTGLLFQALEPTQFEVIVVDGQSDDATVSIVREMQSKFKNLKLLLNPRRLSSAARNLGIRHSEGEFSVVIDGHCEIKDPHYLRKLVDAFESSRADCLGRPQPLRAGHETAFQSAVASARESWLGHNPDSSIFSDEARFIDAENVAVAYRRDVYEQVGLFDESFDACEDVEFNTRVGQAGLSCYFTPAIRVDYTPRSSLRGLLFQMFRYGVGRARLGLKYPRSITLPSLVPPLWIVWLVVSFGLGFVEPIFAAAFCLSIILYCAAVTGETTRLATRSVGRGVVWVPLVFVAIHIGFGWGYLRERLQSLSRAFRFSKPTRAGLPTRIVS